jgi:hypothetical protein
MYKLSSLVVAYSLENDFEIRGTAESLAALAELLDANKAGSLIIELIKPQQPAHPYFGFIEKVLIQNEPHKVVVSRVEDTLVITGDDESLSPLAKTIEWLATHTSNTNSHLHVDFYPEHPYLEPSSGRLVFSIVESSEIRPF